jgi:hypothetical protein
MPNKPWATIGKYRILPLKPLPIPQKKLPHSLGYRPKYLDKTKK